MTRTLIWFFLISTLFPISSNSESQQVQQTLVRFMQTLSHRTPPPFQGWGWTPDSDPCTWTGVLCDPETRVTGIILNGYNFPGRLDARSLCLASSLSVLDLRYNNIFSLLPPEIGDCKNLTGLYIGRNQFTGLVPTSLYQLGSLERVDISGNCFAGRLPAELAWISTLVSFQAQDNRLTGPIPALNGYNLEQFNVSGNGFEGKIPDGYGRFQESCFQANAGLCGPPLAVACPT